MRPFRRWRRYVAGLVAPALVSVLVSCGSDDDPPPPKPRGAAAGAADEQTPTPTGSESPSAEPRPLSKFEGDPSVKVVRVFMRKLGKAVNAGETGLDGKRFKKILTKRAKRRLPILIREDEGQYFPGPIPLTPVRVTGDGRRKLVGVCAQLRGWGQDPKTKLPAFKRRIDAAEFVVVKKKKRWKVHDAYQSPVKCDQVRVVGVPW
ncbi:MAG: hypothetical protein ACRCYQ_15250 [Nocardioides sp.]